MNQTEIMTKEYVTLKKNNFLQLLELYLQIPIDSDIKINVKKMKTGYNNFPNTDCIVSINSGNIKDIKKFIKFLDNFLIVNAELTLIPSNLNFNISQDFVRLSTFGLNKILKEIAVYSTNKESIFDTIYYKMSFKIPNKLPYKASIDIIFSPYLTNNLFEIFSNTLVETGDSNELSKCDKINLCNILRNSKEITEVYLELETLNSTTAISLELLKNFVSK